MRVNEKVRLPEYGVILPPQSRQAFQKGVDTIADLIRVTLGPKARVVAVEQLGHPNSSPEILDDGATIARRIIELPNRYENMGAMLIRNLAWRVREEVGDGSATAIVLAQAVLAEANRYIAAGGNAMALKRGIEKALEVALAEIDQLGRVVDDPEEMAGLITGVSGDPELGKMFGEIYDIIGKDGVLIVQESNATFTDREYVEGVHWDRGYLSPYMATDTDRMEATIESPAVLVSDLFIKTKEEMLPFLEMVHSAGHKTLFMITGDISGEALGLVVVNNQQGSLTTLGVKAPLVGDNRKGVLDDMGLLTGARVFLNESGDTLASVKPEDLGRAQRVWADASSFNLIGGYGNPAAIRQRVAQVKALLPTIKLEYDREKTHERIGKLAGGVAVLMVGAPSLAERKSKLARAENARAAMRAAATGGVVPGGGAAYLACVPALRKIEASGDEAMGVKILMAALEAPTAWIAQNAGFSPRAVLAQLRSKPVGWGFDVVSGEPRNMVEVGVVDPYPVVRVALVKSVSGALMALTTEALVSKKIRPVSPGWVP